MGLFLNQSHSEYNHQNQWKSDRKNKDFGFFSEDSTFFINSIGSHGKYRLSLEIYCLLDISNTCEGLMLITFRKKWHCLGYTFSSDQFLGSLLTPMIPLFRSCLNSLKTFFLLFIIAKVENPSFQWISSPNDDFPEREKKTVFSRENLWLNWTDSV